MNKIVQTLVASAILYGFLMVQPVVRLAAAEVEYPTGYKEPAVIVITHVACDREVTHLLGGRLKNWVKNEYGLLNLPLHWVRAHTAQERKFVLDNWFISSERDYHYFVQNKELCLLRGLKIEEWDS